MQHLSVESRAKHRGDVAGFCFKILKGPAVCAARSLQTCMRRLVSEALNQALYLVVQIQMDFA